MINKESVIKQEGEKWVLYTSDGKRVLGTHDTKEKAEAQERAIQASKYAGYTGGVYPAEGIPSMTDQGDIKSLKIDELADFLVQRHDAVRAGLHRDMRIKSDEGLLSWALPKGMPQPGEKNLAIRTQLHDPSYAGFEGEIEKGYGKGTVTKELEDRALITKADDRGITFTLADRKHPERFRLQKTDKDWLLINVTPHKPLPYKKPVFKSVSPEEVDKLFSPENIVSAKIDGSLSFLHVLGDKIEALSHRTSRTTGRPIVHTERTGLHKARVDPVRDSVLKAETYAVDPEGKTLSPGEISGILNSALSTVLDKNKDVSFRHGVFDIERYKGRDVSDKSYPRRRELAEEIVKRIQNGGVHMMEGERDPIKQRELWEKIKSGRHPLTREGIVSFPDRGKPSKVKPFNEYDVVIKNILEGTGKHKGRAGAIEYARMNNPDKIVGRVGTGMSDELRDQMWKDREDWMGRRARIKAFREGDTGALYGPVFLALHESYN